MKCRNCGHHDFDHYTLAKVPRDRDGKELLPKGTVIPCDVIMGDGTRCECLNLQTDEPRVTA